MDYKPQFGPQESKVLIQPRIIIHGGAGNILPTNLPPAKYVAFASALLRILGQAHAFLTSPDSKHGGSRSALDTAAYAVSLLENDPLFNSGHGAVFTRDGVNEMEASVMVSRGKKKRGVGVMGVRLVKNPILLAREMLIRGEDDLEGGNGEHRGPLAGESHTSSGAQGHSQLFGGINEELAKRWGVETVKDQSYFFTQNRWDEHIKGLEREKKGKNATWDAEEYVSQGTCGAVVLDSDGVLCVSTSTGGMTNKLSGRVGDTPTLGAGFWAEEWELHIPGFVPQAQASISIPSVIKGVLADCLPGLSLYSPISTTDHPLAKLRLGPMDDLDSFTITRSTAISGTGNGDSFLRTAAARTASAIVRYKQHSSLAQAAAEIIGPGGEVQRSAGDRWKKTGEGEGGMIGIESQIVRFMDGNTRHVSEIVDEFNCGGMFRAYVDEKGRAIMRVWRREDEDRMRELGYGAEGTAQELLRTEKIGGISSTT